MGGGGRGSSRTQRRHFRQGRENVWKRSRSENRSQPRTEENNDESNRTPTWEPFATQNEAFNDYYKEQEIVPLEEWGTFIEYLRKPLPAAFRVNASSQFSADIRSQLEDEFMKSFLSDVSDDAEMDGIRPLPWYPDNLAWQSNYSRMQLRKNQTLERFHEFLKQENEIGNITRQEAVSMVPPLLLDVHPDHFVLDMCAAPGSKTFQLLEIIYQSVKLGVLPSGMVIANDLDVQRCNLLIHQTKRMCTANLIVTNHEAQQFPGCRFNKRSSNVIEMGNLKEPHVNKLLFDRVLCDVPCSGDGTLRKAPDIWRRWNAGIGNGLHSLQVQIALRGISLLKVGGRMVYSTCSMNPVENEAVVAEILRRCGGTDELLDVSNELSQLVRRPGLKKWKVRDKGIWLASYKEVREFRRAAILSSMFPSGRSSLESEDNNSSPTGSTADVLDEASDLPLERCMRIVPHDQNSGAFFIAVLHKVSSLSSCDKPMDVDGHLSLKNDDSCEKKIPEEVKEDTNELDIMTEDATDNRSSSAKTALDVGLPENAHLQTPSELDPSEENKHGESLPAPKACPAEGGRRKLQIQGKWKGVDPVVFFNDEAIIDKIRTFYGIDGSFPLDRHLVTRNSDTDHVKRIYYISRSVKDALELNLLVGEQLKIASIGLKMFERQTSKDGAASPCGFRISSEGLPLILPYVTKQILSACLADFNHLLQYKSIKFDNFVDAEFGVAASNLMLGCCVVVLRKGDQTLTDPIQPDESTIAIGCWKGRASLNVMVTAIECRELLERLSKRRERESGPSIVEGDTVKDMNDI